MKYCIFALLLFAFPATMWAEDLELFPQEWDFGDVPLGEFGENTIRGNSTHDTSSVIITRIYLSPSIADFTIEDIFGTNGYDPAIPGIFAPGGFVDVTVRFTPSSLGSQSVDLIFESNDHDDPTQAVTLTGRGVSGVVPEPGSVVVWSLLGAVGLAYAWRRRRV